jgi:hypothetical protein
LGELDSQQKTIANKKDNTKRTYIPESWYKYLLSTIKLLQIAWWDKMYCKCKIGGVSGAKEYFLKILCDDN